MSSPDQVDKFSLDSQERLIRDYCQIQGWPVPTLYREEGRSAYNDDPQSRPVFAAMLGDAKARRFDTLIVIDLDRFARSTLAALLAKRDLEDSGVRLLSLNQQQDFASPDGALFFAIGSGFAEYASAQLSRKVRAGFEQKRQQGLHVGGFSWAARRVEGKLVLREDRVEALRLLFELAARHGLHSTAVILNERGIPAPRGGMWSTTAVSYILGPGAEWLIELGGEWPALVRAARANRRTPAIRHDRATRMLSGLMHCVCGGRLNYSTPYHALDGRTLHTLHCRNKDRAQIVACGKRRTHAEYYEERIAEWFLSLPSLEHGVDVVDSSGPQRALLRERRRRVNRAYHEQLKMSDEEYDTQMAILDEEERLLPPAPLNRQAIAVGVANAQREWPKWAPQTRNLFLRSILSGVLLNGKLVMPVPLDDVRRMIAIAEERQAA